MVISVQEREARQEMIIQTKGVQFSSDYLKMKYLLPGVQERKILKIKQSTCSLRNSLTICFPVGKELQKNIYYIITYICF